MWLAFDAEWDGDSEVYIVRADGKSLTKLTDNDIEDFSPLWSPDGDKIAFLSGTRSEKVYRLYVMNADGSERTLISADLVPSVNISWAPDSLSLAFGAWQGDAPPNLYTAAADGSILKAITRNDGRLTDIGSTTWSPDGQTMAFSAALDDQFLIWHIFRVGADGSSLRDLSPQAAREEHAPKWHPTDDTILFSSHTSSDTSQLYVMKSDGSERRQLTAGEDLKDSASWSPTGEMVTYEVTTNLYEEDKTMYALYVIKGGRDTEYADPSSQKVGSARRLGAGWTSPRLFCDREPSLGPQHRQHLRWNCEAHR